MICRVIATYPNGDTIWAQAQFRSGAIDRLCFCEEWHKIDRFDRESLTTEWVDDPFIDSDGVAPFLLIPGGAK